MLVKDILLCLLYYTTIVAAAQDAACHDVTIVGAGVGGAYSAWRLRQRGLNIGVYEYSDRIGGRFYTKTFPAAPDIPIELGAMRFVKEDAIRLHKAIVELGLTTEQFQQRTPSQDGLYYLRGVHLRSADFEDDNVPYNLRPNEKKGLTEIYRYLTAKTNFSGNMASLKEERPFLVSENGTRLTDIPLPGFLKMYLSVEAMVMVHHTSRVLQDIPTSSGEFFVPSNESEASYDKVTIAGGMQQLPETLISRFLEESYNHSLSLNNHLVSIRKREDGMFSLMFEETTTNQGKTRPAGSVKEVCSQKVILAIPSTSLLHIDWFVFQREPILMNLKSVNSIHYYKLFLAYDYPWWRNVTEWSPECPLEYLPCHSSEGNVKFHGYSSVLSDLPLQMTYDFGVSTLTGKAVLLVAYSFHEMLKTLRDYGEPFGAVEDGVGVSTEVVRHAHLYLARLHNMRFEDLPFPIDGMLMPWDDYPYGSPFTHWRVGIEWSDVWHTLRKPSESDDLFIASGTYFRNHNSDYWSENCLEAVEDILKDYF